MFRFSIFLNLFRFSIFGNWARKIGDIIIIDKIFT